MSKRLWQVLSLVVLSTTLGCEMPSSSSTEEGTTASSSSESSSESSSQSEAERTRQIEEKAAGIARREEEIRNMQGTEQEKIDAVNELERERRELMEMQESGGGN
jgi:TolA-binding protein